MDIVGIIHQVLKSFQISKMTIFTVINPCKYFSIQRLEDKINISALVRKKIKTTYWVVRGHLAISPDCSSIRDIVKLIE